MRINPINYVGNVYKPGKASKAYGESSVSTSKDSLALSDFAKELSVAKKAVNQTPDIRHEKVNAIKSQMEAGTYNVSAAQVADKILGQL